ncbi:cellulose binding domain-containing protein [Streptomyces ovatisporus]|uniref:Cellulose binding domain-containing protein n=1 Tax=Streptomyces ovatisporus TaxID=1128682 RepID=A0ABV9A648_9ACTN
MSTEDSESRGVSRQAEEPDTADAPDAAEASGDGPGSPSLVRPYADLPVHMVEAPAVLNTPAPHALDAPGALDEPDAQEGAAGSGPGEARPRWASLLHGPAGGVGPRRIPARRLLLTGAAFTGVLLLVLTVVLHQTGGWPFEQSGARTPRAGAGPPASPETEVPGTGAPSEKKEKATADSGSSPSPKAGDGAGDDEPTDSAEDDRAGPDETGPPSAPAAPAPGGPGGGGGDPGCDASWHVGSQWEDFTATVRVTNTTGRPVHGWEVTWTWHDDKRFTKTWNAEIQQSGNSVTARNVSTNGEISPAGEVTFGFEATGSGSPAPRLTCRVL